jgi:hypothetical protein
MNEPDPDLDPAERLGWETFAIAVVVGLSALVLVGLVLLGLGSDFWNPGPIDPSRTPLPVATLRIVPKRLGVGVGAAAVLITAAFALSRRSD